MNSEKIVKSKSLAVEIIFLVFLAAATYIGTCAKPALFDEADATNAEVGYQMVRTGDWITPVSNYVPRLNKPPMTYWVIAISYEFLGISDFSARLPFALAAIGVIIVTFLLGNLFGSRYAGLYSGIVLSTSLGFFLFTRTISGDILFIFFLSLGFYCFIRLYLRDIILRQALGGNLTARHARDVGRSVGWMIGFWACLALAVMSKGLIGLVFPVLTIGGFLLILRDWSFLKKTDWLLGLAIFFAIAAPWHVIVGTRNPGFFYEYFINEHVLRFLNMHYPKDFQSLPLWKFWLIQLVGLFPWVVFLPRARCYLPKNRGRMSVDEQLLMFLGFWAISLLLFFSVSARLEHYALPAYPACAVIIGFILAKEAEKGRVRTLARSVAPVAVIGLLSSVAVVVFLTTFRQGEASTAMGAHDKLTYFGLVGGASRSVMASMRNELLVFAAGLVFAGAAGVLALRRNRILIAVLVIVLGTAGMLVAIQNAEEKVEPYLSLRSLAEQINRRSKPGDMVAIQGEFFNTSSIGLYTRKPVYRWRGHPDWDFGSRFGNARRMFVDDAEMLRAWTSPREVFLVVDKSTPQSVKFLRNAHILGKCGDSVLISNH